MGAMTRVEMMIPGSEDVDLEVLGHESRDDHAHPEAGEASDHPHGGLDDGEPPKVLETEQPRRNDRPKERAQGSHHLCRPVPGGSLGEGVADDPRGEVARRRSQV